MQDFSTFLSYFLHFYAEQLIKKANRAQFYGKLFIFSFSDSQNSLWRSSVNNIFDCCGIEDKTMARTISSLPLYFYICFIS